MESAGPEGWQGRQRQWGRGPSRGLGPWWRGHGLPLQGHLGSLQLDRCAAGRDGCCHSAATSPWCSCCAER